MCWHCCGEERLRDALPISNLHACAFNKLVFQNLEEKGKLYFVTQHISRKRREAQKQFYIETDLRLPFPSVLQRQGAAKIT